MNKTYKELVGKKYLMNCEKEYIIDTLFDVDYKMVEAQEKNIELEIRIQKALSILEHNIKDNKEVIDILRGEDKPEYLGYSDKECINCGRLRVEKYSDGTEICEKCNFDQNKKEYVLRGE